MSKGIFKRDLMALFTICYFLCAIISCKDINEKIQSIYIKAANEDIFQIQDEKSIYYYQDGKNEKFVLNAHIKKDEGLLNIQGLKNTPKINWYYQKNEEKKEKIENWTNSKNEEIAAVRNENLTINISKIDLLSDYKIIADCDGVKSEYCFTIDSKKDIDDKINVFYVKEPGDDAKLKNKVDQSGKTQMFLSSATSYLFSLKENDSIGTVTFENKTPDIITLSDKNGRNIVISYSKDNEIYITTSENINEHGIIEIKAGNKKIKEIYITINDIEEIISTLDAPVISAEPIIDGYKLIFTCENKEILDEYQLVLKINNDAIIKANERYIKDDEKIGFFYNITGAGEYNIEAYFQKDNLRSQSCTKTLNIRKDNILSSMSVGGTYDFLEEENIVNIPTQETWNKDETIKIVKLNFGNFLYTNLNPFTRDKSFYPYKHVRAKICVVDDCEHFYDILLDYSSETTWSYEIKNSLKCDKVLFKIRLYNILGIAEGDEYVYEVENRKIDFETNFCYLKDATYDANMAQYSLKINKIDINPYYYLYGNLPSNSHAYISCSSDEGKNFSITQNIELTTTLKSHKQENGSYLYEIYEHLLKNSRSSIIRGKIYIPGYKTIDLGAFTTANLESAPSPIVISDNSVQDAPNTRKAKVVFDYKNDFDVYYTITNGEDVGSSNLWQKIDFEKDKNYKIVDVIKCRENTPSSKIEKTLWLKTISKNDNDITPSLCKFNLEISRAPRPITCKNDGVLWKNKGFFSPGIVITLTSPDDDCYCTYIARTENISANSKVKFNKKGDTKDVVTDWDQCLAAYRFNRFYIAAYTSKAGYIDSEIDEYCGWERSNYDNQYKYWHDEGEKAVEKLKNTWRCKYEF